MAGRLTAPSALADEGRRRYLFVAIDRATRRVFVRIYPAKTAAKARLAIIERQLAEIDETIAARGSPTIPTWPSVSNF